MGLGRGLGPASTEIRVPDIPTVMTILVDDEKDIDDVLYELAAGPITIRDPIKAAFLPKVDVIEDELFGLLLSSSGR